MLILKVLLTLYLQVGMGTTFSSNDVYNPNPTLACRPGVILKDSDPVIAHRELPCGAKVSVCNPRTKKCTIATVLDRGPFGILGKGNKRTYTSIVDMSPGVTKLLGHNGFEPVYILSPWPIENRPPPAPKKKKYQRRDS